MQQALHSPDDGVVDINNAHEIYRLAPMPKSFIAMDGADHLLSKADIGQWVGGIVAAWAGNYLS